MSSVATTSPLPFLFSEPCPWIETQCSEGGRAPGPLHPLPLPSPLIATARMCGEEGAVQGGRAKQEAGEGGGGSSSCDVPTPRTRKHLFVGPKCRSAESQERAAPPSLSSQTAAPHHPPQNPHEAGEGKRECGECTEAQYWRRQSCVRHFSARWRAHAPPVTRTHAITFAVVLPVAPIHHLFPSLPPREARMERDVAMEEGEDGGGASTGEVREVASRAHRLVTFFLQSRLALFASVYSAHGSDCGARRALPPPSKAKAMKPCVSACTCTGAGVCTSFCISPFFLFIRRRTCCDTTRVSLCGFRVRAPHA